MPLSGYLILIRRNRANCEENQAQAGSQRGKMLLVRTHLDRSEIHGMGLFADELIPEGTLIWKFMDGFDAIIPADQVKSLPEVVREYIDRYGYLKPEGGGFVLCGDDARFFNHSDYPNTISLSQEITVALRDINKGEELTCNYYEFDATAENHFKREHRNGKISEIRAWSLRYEIEP